MADELMWRLRNFGHLPMDDDGNLGEWTPNPLTNEAADRIDQLETIAKLARTLQTASNQTDQFEAAWALANALDQHYGPHDPTPTDPH